MSFLTSFLDSLRAMFVARPVTTRDRRKHWARLAQMRLEDRTVPTVVGIRSIDGSGNNLAHPAWGQASTDFLRIAPAAYTDGISSPAGATRPSARAISNAVSDQSGQDIISDRNLAAMIYAWGQFVDHDLDNTQTGTTELFNVAVPTGDASFDPTSTGTKVINLVRSAYDPLTGTTTARQQVNTITAYLDGSMVYGSDATTAASLRTFVGGKLKTSSGNLLPTDAAGNYLAGDARVNENPELTAIQTLFLREHNRIATLSKAAHPSWTDEQVFQDARAQVIAEIQAITVNEWLPTLIGSTLAPYRGYNPNVNAGISNEFATAAYRMGHSLLGDDIEFLNNDGTEAADGIALKDAFFNPTVLATHSLDSIIKYLSADPASEVDTKVVDGVRNFLFGAPGSGCFDLASLNIQRGRDHGIADYNTARAAYGLPRVTSFAQITKDPALQAKLQALYGSVNNIDLWVGALAEDHVPGGSVGPTTRAILLEQFSRTRDGDRFWYQNVFSGQQLRDLDHTTLADVIRRNTALTTVQANAFVFKASVSGSVFGDPNRNGRLDPGERTFAGRAVQLIDADGAVVATATTDANGVYRFTVADGLRTGVYTVHQVLPTGATATTPDRIVSVTGGDVNVRADLGSVAGQVPPMPPPPHHTMPSTDVLQDLLGIDVRPGRDLGR